ncbi:MAG: hypothetical protein ACI83I_002723, partial [Bacteroidia bacterium]
MPLLKHSKRGLKLYVVTLVLFYLVLFDDAMGQQPNSLVHSSTHHVTDSVFKSSAMLQNKQGKLLYFNHALVLVSVNKQRNSILIQNFVTESLYLIPLPEVVVQSINNVDPHVQNVTATASNELEIFMNYKFLMTIQLVDEKFEIINFINISSIFNLVGTTAKLYENHILLRTDTRFRVCEDKPDTIFVMRLSLTDSTKQIISQIPFNRNSEMNAFQHREWFGGDGFHFIDEATAEYYIIPVLGTVKKVFLHQLLGLNATKAFFNDIINKKTTDNLISSEVKTTYRKKVITAQPFRSGLIVDVYQQLTSSDGKHEIHYLVKDSSKHFHYKDSLSFFNSRDRWMSNDTINLGDLPSTFNWTWTIVLDSEIISVIPYTSVVLTEGTPISDFRE